MARSHGEIELAVLGANAGQGDDAQLQDIFPLPSRPVSSGNWPWRLWALWPELVLLLIFVMVNLATALLLTRGEIMFAGVYRSLTPWGLIFCVGLPHLVVHMLRLLGSVCCCSFDAGNAHAKQVDLPREALVHRCYFALCDLAVIVFWYLTFGLSSMAAWGRSYSLEEAAGSPEDLASRMKFPENFRFGAGSSAYQVEGGLFNSNWYEWQENFTHARGYGPPVCDGQQVGLAADVWNHFSEDVESMQSIGLQTYRLSIAWSRVHPTRDFLDEQAVRQYRDWMQQLRRARIEPIVTLHHYDEPIWVLHQGSWTNDTTVLDWLRFVRFVVQQLQDVVDLYCTMNEAFSMAGLGYLLARWPPGLRWKLDQWWLAISNMVSAHKQAYKLLHEVDVIDADGDGASALVGNAMPINLYKPKALWNIIDPAMAGLCIFTATLWYLGAIEAESHLDWIGVNHHFLVMLGMDIHSGSYEMSSVAHSLRSSVWEVHKWYPGKRLHVTHHGIDQAGLRDARRAAFVTRALAGLQKAAELGAPVDSYQYWSLLDTFEWEDGFYPRYGLFVVDFTNRERTARDFAGLYGEMAKAHASSRREYTERTSEVRSRRLN